MKTLKTNIFEIVAGLSILAAIAILLAFSAGTFGPRTASASGQSIQCTDSSNAGCQPNATSTPSFGLSPGALTSTSTLATVFTPNATQLDLYLNAAASSTSSVILWQYSFSFDGANYYPESSQTTAGVATPLIHSWIPGRTASTTLETKLTPLGAKYVRISVWGSVASSTVFSQIVLDNLIPN